MYVGIDHRRAPRGFDRGIELQATSRRNLKSAGAVDTTTSSTSMARPSSSAGAMPALAVVAQCETLSGLALTLPLSPMTANAAPALHATILSEPPPKAVCGWAAQQPSELGCAPCPEPRQLDHRADPDAGAQHGDGLPASRFAPRQGIVHAAEIQFCNASLRSPRPSGPADWREPFAVCVDHGVGFQDSGPLPFWYGRKGSKARPLLSSCRSPSGRAVRRLESLM